jgi:NAD-dependent dihydropyrimidine dehydrogenase PreA subunit
VTYVITQPCIDEQDQSCVEVCPVDCIQFEDGADRMLYIDPVECIDCGACVPVCPVDAIFSDDEVPAEVGEFTEINALWYQDRAAARARIGGDGAAGSPAATPTETADAPAASEPAADEPAAEPAAAEAPVAAAPAPTQVEAIEEEAPGGIIVPEHSLPSPLGLVAVVGIAISFVVMWIGPDPRWPDFFGLAGPSKAGVGIAIVPALVFLALFLRSQFGDLARFSSSRTREVSPWRNVTADWRRSEETRRHELSRAVREIARTRFQFPNDQFPDYQTHTNVPQPTMAIEFGGAGVNQTFPDIVVVEYPGNYPVMIAQVETAETLTREQAERVWSRLEMKDAPLDIYVPAGLAARAKDYARAAGLKHVRFRTWRHNPTGILVREV